MLYCNIKKELVIQRYNTTASSVEFNSSQTLPKPTCLVLCLSLLPPILNAENKERELLVYLELLLIPKEQKSPYPFLMDIQGGRSYIRKLYIMILLCTSCHDVVASDAGTRVRHGRTCIACLSSFWHHHIIVMFHQYSRP